MFTKNKRKILKLYRKCDIVTVNEDIQGTDKKESAKTQEKLRALAISRKTGNQIIN